MKVVNKKYTENALDIEVCTLDIDHVGPDIYLQMSDRCFSFNESMGKNKNEDQQIDIFIFQGECDEGDEQVLTNIIEIIIPEANDMEFPVAHVVKTKEEFYIRIFEWFTKNDNKEEIEVKVILEEKGE